MKTFLALCFAVCFLCSVFNSKLAYAESANRDKAIEKAKTWLESSLVARPIVDAYKEKDIFDPEKNVYNNSVSVSKDFKEVTFHHNGKPYDSDSISFIGYRPAFSVKVVLERQAGLLGFKKLHTALRSPILR